jgi:catalase-peroxidase
MTALLGGLRVLGANYDGSEHGVFTDKPGTLSNDFFVNLLDMSTQWRKAETDGMYEGIDRETGEVKYQATTVDLIFGSNSELRAVAETYAYANSEKAFANDFVDAWVKVMRADRYDLKQ